MARPSACSGLAMQSVLLFALERVRSALLTLAAIVLLKMAALALFAPAMAAVAPV